MSARTEDREPDREITSTSDSGGSTTGGARASAGATFRERLARGDTVLGPFVNLASPALVEVAALAGFDFLVLDMEHAPLDVATIENLCRTADSVGIAPIVRVAKRDPVHILRALDLGPAAVQVPHVSTPQEAEDVVAAARYAPLGSRGMSPYTRAGRYFSAGGAVTERINRETLVAIQVEGLQGIESLEEIVQVEGLDIVFLGPYDLSQAIGIPAQVWDPRVKDRMTAAVEVINAAGLTAGTYADAPEGARHWMSTGVRYMSLCVDAGIYLHGCRAMIRETFSEDGTPPRPITTSEVS
jgi:4-hydroxy-2-oxoheptanedioate aldolase